MRRLPAGPGFHREDRAAGGGRDVSRRSRRHASRRLDYEASGRIGVGIGASTPLDFVHSRFTDTSGSLTGFAVQHMGNTATSYSGMLFYDHTGALGQFQSFNDITRECRINNIAPKGSINFMLSSQSKFRVRPDGGFDIIGNIYKGQFMFLRAAGSGSVHSIGLGERALNNSVGTANIAIGSDAIGGPGSGGERNIGIGNSTLRANAGIGNVGLGYSLLTSSAGSSSIAIGDQAGCCRLGMNDHDIYIGASVDASGAADPTRFASATRRTTRGSSPAASAASRRVRPTPSTWSSTATASSARSAHRGASRPTSRTWPGPAAA